jgi:hypothetical protein
MKRLALAILLVLAGTPAHAQQAPQAISPAPLVGYGTLSVLLVSIPISGATLGPNSAAFPTGNLPNKYITVKSATGAANPLFVCPLGGTCTTANGIPLAAGESQTWMLAAPNGQFVSPTVITAGTATAIVSW